MQFNSGWPISLTTNSANSALSSAGTSLSSLVSGVASIATNVLSKFIGATDTDSQHLNALGAMPAPVDTSGKRAYMAAVSPWFFTHYSPQTFNKNVSLPSLLCRDRLVDQAKYA
jgi:glucan endo-1,3-alpha-glucosidase